MNYRESRVYIEQISHYGSVLGLDTMRELMRRLDNPQDSLKFVHVAGTNGKGSVLAYISSVLKEAGYKVGRYISPSIFSYLERMDINGIPISEEDFAKYLTQVAEAADGMKADGLAHPTVFEVETAVAFLYFHREKCDVVALETGLGGLLDATNIVKNTLVAVLTPISLDHTEYLGGNLHQIAKNKAGIIKDNCKVVSTLQREEAMAVIENICRQRKIPLTVADTREVYRKKTDYMGSRFEYHGIIYETNLGGIYQTDNAATALLTLELLREMGYAITREDMIQGIQATCWGGRFSVIGREPLFVIDGAHNPDAAEKLAASIKEYFSDKRVHFIMGMFQDKDYKEVIRMTVPLARDIIAVTIPGNGRVLPGGAMEAHTLAKEVGKVNSHVESANSLREAVDRAYEKAQPEDVIIAFGTLSFLGKISEIVRNRQEK